MKKSSHSQKRQNYAIVCQNCNTLFYANRSTARYCCNACKAMYARRMFGQVNGEIVIDQYGRKVLKAKVKPYKSQKYAEMKKKQLKEQEKKLKQQQDDALWNAGAKIAGALTKNLMK